MAPQLAPLGHACDMCPSKHSRDQSHNESQEWGYAVVPHLLNLHAESARISYLPDLCLSMKHFLLKWMWCYKWMKSMNQINLKRIGFQTCLKWSLNWCISSTLFIKMAFLMSSCYCNLQSTGQTSTFVYLYHSFLTKEQGFIKEINHLCTV